MVAFFPASVFVWYAVVVGVCVFLAAFSVAFVGAFRAREDFFLDSVVVRLIGALHFIPFPSVVPYVLILFPVDRWGGAYSYHGDTDFGRCDPYSYCQWAAGDRDASATGNDYHPGGRHAYTGDRAYSANFCRTFSGWGEYVICSL